MILKYELDSVLEAEIKKHLGEDIKYCVPADLSIDGVSKSNGWLAIGDFSFATVWENGVDRVENISHCSDFKLTAMIGNGFLECNIDGRPTIIARFTMEHVARYGYIAQILNQMSEGKDVRVSNTEEEVRCPKCGRMMIRGTNICPKCSNKGSAVKRILRMCIPYWYIVVAVLLLLGVSTFISLQPPKIYKQIIDECLGVTTGVAGNFPLLVKYIGFVIACGIASWLVNVFIAVFRTNFGASLTRDMRKGLFEKIQSLSLGYVLNHKAGDIINRVTRDTQRIRQFVFTVSINIVQQLVLFVVLCVLLFSKNWIMALIILVPAPVAFRLQTYLWRRVLGPMYRKMHREDDNANNLLHDIINGIRVVKIFGREENEVQRYKRASRKIADISIKAESKWAYLWPVASFILNLGMYAVTFLGCYIIMGHMGMEMTLGELIEFTTLAQMVYQPMHSLMMAPRVITDAMIGMQRINEIMDQKVEIEEKEDAVKHSICGEVCFENVTFGYRSYEPVLKNVSFTVKQGEMIGLVGKSGAGKSTLTNLVSRLYDVQEGRILIDGVDIRDISKTDLRSQIGVVLQESFLFTGSVFDNIRYARPDATREEVIRAAMIANAHSFIVNLPDGYDSRVDEGGNNFSTGEKQRLAIARCLLSNPKMLILDEATSALDLDTEALIQEALQRLVKGKTTFAIAHRLSTLKNADRLFVIDNGKIAEMGTHDELMRQKGIYYGLVIAQRSMTKIKRKGNVVQTEEENV